MFFYVFLCFLFSYYYGVKLIINTYVPYKLVKKTMNTNHFFFERGGGDRQIKFSKSKKIFRIKLKLYKLKI